MYQKRKGVRVTKDEIQQAIINAMGQHASYTSRLSSASVNEILKQFDTLSNAQIRELQELLEGLSSAELSALASARYTTPELKDIKSTLDEWMTQITTQLQPIFTESAVALVAYESAYIYRLADKESPAINGESLYKKAQKNPYGGGLLIDQIFPNISQQLRKNVERTIRDGITQNQTSQQIVQRIKGTRKQNYNDGLLAISRKDITTEVITARSHVTATAYAETWKALGFEYVIDLATLDGRTSKYCSMIDHRVQKLDEKTKKPPYHRRCRTVQVGTDKNGNIDSVRPFVASDKPVSKIPKDQRTGVIGQVDADTTYSEWFSQQDDQFQRNWLGASRYKLYKDGKYPLSKFVDPLSGELFTLSELKKMDEQTFKAIGL